MADKAARQRAWPVRMLVGLVSPFTSALVTGVADPPTPRPAWRTPDALAHMVRYVPTRTIDIVVVAEIVIAIAIYAGTNSMLVDANQRAGLPIADGELFILAAAGASVPLLLRDRWPLAAWRVSIPSMLLVVSVSQQVLGDTHLNPYVPGANLTYLLVLYSVAVRCPRRVSVGAWLVSLLGMLILYPDPSFFLGAVATGAALLFGYNVRTRRAAQQQVVVEEQRTEDERGARSVLEERSRIARELHDVVAHHMSVIAIQAEAAPIKAPDDPEALKAELASIRVSSLAALTELRRVLGLLREGDEPPQTAPQPDLSGLQQLLANSRAAGMVVTLTTAGRPPSAETGVELVAYRLVQESLSNALRHAPGAAVQVLVEHGPGTLRLRVINQPPAGAAPASPPGPVGQGLAGMRERVGALGGSLTTGPTPAGGFEVAAVLPLARLAMPGDGMPAQAAEDS